MRRISSLFLFLLFLSLSVPLFGSYFEVENYRVEMKVNPNGSIDITERIQVEFSSSRHGIIREIPIRYEVKEIGGEVAENHGPPGSEYLLWVDKPLVENYQYEVIREYGMLKFKIGSPDVWVNGAQEYVIHYTVWGGINFFRDGAELYWNLTGNNWTEKIKKVEWEIEFPGKPYEIQAWTGLIGSTDQNAEWELDGNVFKGHTTQTLLPREGITVGAGIKRKYVRNEPIPLEVKSLNHYVQGLDMQLELFADGHMHVRETLWVHLKPGQTDFVRSMPYSEDKWLSERVKSEPFGYYRSKNGAGSVSFSNLDPDEKGNVELVLEYDLWKVIFPTIDGDYLDMNILNGLNTHAVMQAQVELTLQDGLDSLLKKVYVGQEHGLPPQPKGSREGNKILGGAAGPFDLMGNYYLGARFKKGTFADAVPPIRLQASNWYLDTARITLRVQKDGWIDIENDYKIGIVDKLYHFTELVSGENYVSWSTEGEPQNKWLPKMPNGPLFGYKYRWIVTRPEVEPEPRSINKYRGDYDIIWDYANNWKDYRDIKMNWSVFGLIREQSDGSYLLQIPVFEDKDEPTQTLIIDVYLPEGGNFRDAKLFNFVNHSSTEVLNFDRKKNVASIHYNQGIEKYTSLQADFSFESPALSLSFWGTLRHFAKNNIWLIWPWFIGLGLFLLWFFAGKDRKFTKVVRYYPPEGMNSAEAGYLTDFKVKSDALISLIYYWGDKKLLKIEQGQKAKSSNVFLTRDYTGTPAGLKDYERVMFRKIFGTKKKRVQLKKLRNSFYSSLDSAEEKLEKQAEKEDWFVGWTLTAGAWLRGLGIAAAVPAVLVGAYVFFEFSYSMREAWDVPLSFALLSLFLFLTGKFLPKRAPKGQEKFEELAGFREFIDKAEKDRLNALVQEDPAYFGHTLAFALAFGMADQWADKFGDLLSRPPEWFDSDPGPSFSASIFMDQFNDNLRFMGNTLQSRPAPSGGSSSGYSSYSSGSSYSSSSSSSSFGSSGGSFSSGGGSSGGGYGGGGGSSW